MWENGKLHFSRCISSFDNSVSILLFICNSTDKIVFLFASWFEDSFKLRNVAFAEELCAASCGEGESMELGQVFM